MAHPAGHRRAVGPARRTVAIALALAGALWAAGGAAHAQDDGAAITVEPVRFESRDATLAGSIYLPTGAPAAGVVLVHGSGPAPRMDELARRLAGSGFAVLSYDKRGVGESGGVYEGVYNISQDNLHLLAADAAAAVDTLAADRRLAGAPVGFMGVSQAGWIIPLAATETERARFMVFWSSVVGRVSDELLYSAADEERAAAEERSGAPPAALVRQYAEQIRADGTDVDSSASLSKLTIPGLWVFGGRDESMPNDLSIARLEELIAGGQTYFEYELYPEGGHVNMGPSAAEAYRRTVAWIRDKGAASRSDGGASESGRRREPLRRDRYRLE